MSNEQQTVAVLGAGGILGLGMAKNLAKGGFTVRAWNRTREKADPLAEDGAQIFESAAEAVRGADVILSILFDAEATQAVLAGDDGALAARADGAIWLQMATLGAHGTAECMELAAREGIPFVDAPVLGTRAPAMKGELVVLASGDEAVRPQVQGLFDAIGSRTIWAGGSGAGTQLKLVVNAWLVAAIQGMADSIALAEGIGVDPQLFLDAVSGGVLDMPYLGLKGGNIIKRDFAPSFTLAGGAKDAQLVVDVAERHGLDLPVPAAIAARMAEGAKTHGEEDITATYRLSAPPATAG